MEYPVPFRSSGHHRRYEIPYSPEYDDPRHYRAPYRHPRRKPWVGDNYSEESLDYSPISLQLVREPHEPDYSSSRHMYHAPFREVARRLHKALEEGHKFYKDLLEDFNSDVMAIRTYTDIRLIDEIWRSKVRGSKDSRPRDNQEDRHSDEGSDSRSREGLVTYSTVSRKLEEALQGAAYGLPDYSRGEARRLVKKLRVTCNQISEILTEAMRYPRVMSDLIKETDFAIRVLKEHREVWEEQEHRPGDHSDDGDRDEERDNH